MFNFMFIRKLFCLSVRDVDARVCESRVCESRIFVHLWLSAHFMG